jgi:large conductance mechanosensitive channel
MFKDFKEFAMGGNVVDMAVGIVIGAAFGTIVSSLVADIIMPPIGLLMGGIDFANIFTVLREGSAPGPYATLEAAHKAGAITINWGNFINTIISFLIIAFAIFMVIRGINKMRKEQEAAPAEPSTEEVLLTEMRDLLKTQAQLQALSIKEFKARQ